MRRIIVLTTALTVLLPSPRACAQSDRADALVLAASRVLHRDSVRCARSTCAPVGLLVSAYDSARLASARLLGVVPVTAASLNSLTSVKHVLSVQELRVSDDVAFIRIEELVSNDIPTPWMSPLMPQPVAPGLRFHRAGHEWGISCVKHGDSWSVTRIEESIV